MHKNILFSKLIHLKKEYKSVKCVKNVQKGKVCNRKGKDKLKVNMMKLLLWIRQKYNKMFRQEGWERKGKGSYNTCNKCNAIMI